MTETSRFWNTNNVGDGPTAGFDRDAVAQWLRHVWAKGGAGGVLRGVLNELAVTGSSSPLAVNTGSAIVYGLYYWNTASVNLTVTTPSVGTTGGHVILRVSWSAQTVRLVAVRNTDGTAAIPALTQTPGTTYEIRLATFTITTGGVITLTDARTYVAYSDSQGAEAITALTGLSVLGRASNTTGASAAITAGTEEYVLRRSGSVLDFGQVATDGIADDAVTAAKIADGAVQAAQIAAGAVGNGELADSAVDDTKLGNRVPQMYRRQGGSASIWGTPGTTEYTPGEVMMQAGIASGSMGAGVATQDLTITYPVAFSAGPLVLLTMAAPSENQTYYIWHQYTPGPSAIIVNVVRFTTTNSITYSIQWLAIGTPA
jgi:hypothetical protein